MKPKHIITGFDGHIILYCKNNYKCPKGLHEGLRMIWAIRCGHNYTSTDKSTDRYIANKLYKLLQQLIPNKISYLQERIHRDINDNWRYEGLNTLERLISIYASEIMSITIKEKIDNRYYTIISLPKPNKRVMNRIIRGNGKYNDYYLIEPKL